MKIRILYLVTDLALGGTPRSIESLLLGLDRTRFDPEVVTLLAPSPITDHLNESGIRCRALGLRHKLDLARLAPLVRLIRGGRFGIVHAWLFHANIIARLVALASGVIVLSSERGVERTKTKLRVLVDRWTSPLTRLIVVNAGAIKATLASRERIDPAKVRVIPNGVDPSRFGPPGSPPPPPLKLICVARLDPIKAHEDLISVLPALGERFDGLALDLVGDGPMRGPLESQIRRLGLGGRVRVLGARDDVPALLQQAHVFVLSSRSEGMPGSVLEAMATGLPVVATRVGGTPEIVEDGRSGLLVEPGDRSALQQAIETVLSSPERRRAMGEAGLARVHERFTREAFIRAHELLYEELAGAAGVRGPGNSGEQRSGPGVDGSDR
ncbi:MAG: glycosyltransferase [Candidatus Riflebacteria bacterium]|nr:glycosyltransferase [Candidatus Riflebacteria bacterium]